MSNVKNYSEQGGERFVINGELSIGYTGRLKLSGMRLKPAAAQADSSASTVSALKDEFNELIKNLQLSGLMERAVIVAQEDSEVDNRINTSTNYYNVSDEHDACVADAIISLSAPLPAGAKVQIVNPVIGGESVLIPAGADTIWLSDVIHAQNESMPIRTKLNLHTTQAFDFVVSGLAEDMTVDITLKAVASDLAGLSGTHQSEAEMTSYIVLTSASIIGVILKADEPEE